MQEVISFSMDFMLSDFSEILSQITKQLFTRLFGIKSTKINCKCSRMIQINAEFLILLENRCRKSPEAHKQYVELF